jgi:hypothetical protein
MPVFEQKNIFMEKKRVVQIRESMAPYLFGLYFIIYQSSKSFYSFNLFDAFLFIAVYSLLVALLQFVLLRFFSLRAAAISIVILAALLLFTDFIRYGIRDMLSIFSFRNRYYLLAVVSFTVLLVYIEHTINVKHKALARKINKGCNVFLLVLILIALINGFTRMYRTQTNKGAISNISKKYTGIVWVLMDEYPAAGLLKQYFNYADPLDSFLVQHHFVLLDSIRSRYPSTLFSINSIFNYDDSIPPENFETAIYRLRKSKWSDDIAQSHARFLNLDFIAIGNQQKLTGLGYFPDTYQKQLLYGSLFNNFMAAMENKEVDTYNTLVNKSLDSVLQKNPDGYKLIWAHFLIPHSPYFRNGQGHLQEDNGEAHDAKTAKGKYIDYVEYGNSLIESLVKQHPVLENKILIISGDHGARFPFVNKKDWFKPYCAIHFPSAFDTSSLKKLNYISQLPAWLANNY